MCFFPGYQIFGCRVGMPRQIHTLITVSALYRCFRVSIANAKAGFFSAFIQNDTEI